MNISKNFTIDELRCRHCGEYLIVKPFVERLQALRDEYGKPIIVTSWYRCPEYNSAVSKTGPKGPHTTGRAVDIAVFGEEAYILVSLAIKHGFAGLGASQKGSFDKRFVHLDDLGSPFPRPWLWSY